VLLLIKAQAGEAVSAMAVNDNNAAAAEDEDELIDTTPGGQRSSKRNHDAILTIGMIGHPNAGMSCQSIVSCHFG
jgi:hypothetical protein